MRTLAPMQAPNVGATEAVVQRMHDVAIARRANDAARGLDDPLQPGEDVRVLESRPAQLVDATPQLLIDAADARHAQRAARRCA
jgi:hypothetical protein